MEIKTKTLIVSNQRFFVDKLSNDNQIALIKYIHRNSIESRIAPYESMDYKH